MTMSEPHRVAVLVKTAIVDAIPLAEGNALRFRIEIFLWSESEYTCQIWRHDTYRIRPSFVPGSADEEILVIDSGIRWHELRATTADKMLSKALAAIEDQLNVTIERPGSSIAKNHDR